MAITTGLIILAGVIILIWVLIEMKRFKHKIFAIFLIVLIVASYFAFSQSIKGNEINYKTPSGIVKGLKLYFAWFIGLFKNVGKTAGYVTNLNWKGEAQTNSSKTNE